MAQHTKSSILRSVIDEVERLSGRFAAVTARLAEGTGVSASELVVLTAVVRAPRPPTVPQIGRSLGHTRQSVQRLADALVQRGMLAWADNPDHARARLLTATSDGRAAYAIADGQVGPWAARVTRGVTADELASLAADLHRLRVHVEDVERQRRS